MNCGLINSGIYIVALLSLSVRACWKPQQWQQQTGLSDSCGSATISLGHHIIFSVLNKCTVVTPTKPRTVRHRWKRYQQNKHLYSYLVCMLLLAGDIHLNPGPTQVEVASPDQEARNVQTKPVGSNNVLHVKLQQRRDFFSIQTVNHAKILWNPRAKPTGLMGGHLNVRSIISKTDELDKLLSDSNLDFLCLSETWLTPNSPDSVYAISGYNVFRKDRQTGRGGGLLLYIKECLRSTRYELAVNFECMAVSVSLSENMSFIIICLYRPPSSNNCFYDEFKALVSHFEKTGKEFMIVGDFNINWSSKSDRKKT